MASDLTPAVKAAAEALLHFTTDSDGYTDYTVDDYVIDAEAAVTAARPHVESDLLRSLASELRRSRATGGIEYVDAAWLDARADQISRGGGERG